MLVNGLLMMRETRKLAAVPATPAPRLATGTCLPSSSPRSWA
jgi:hypothetical protein